MGKIHASRLKIGDTFFYHNRTGVFSGKVVDENKGFRFKMPYWNVETTDGDDIVFQCDYVYDCQVDAVEDFVRMATEHRDKLIEKRLLLDAEIKVYNERIRTKGLPA